jgi:hypothetical protein
MRRTRVTLLMLSLALILSAAAFAEPLTEPTPVPLQQLEEAIFSAPAIQEDLPWSGFCAWTCEPCGLMYGECPPYRGRPQRCAEYCY